MQRIGEKMKLALQLCRTLGGCPKLTIAERVGANGSRKYGYEIVDRCIRRGLIENRSDKPGRYALYLTNKGRSYLE